MVDSQQLVYLNALRSLPGVGDKTLRMLLTQGDPKQLWQQGLSNASPFSKKVLEAFSQRQTLIESPEQLYQALLDQNIELVTEDNPRYPPLLLEIPDHPYLLYIRGNYDFSTIRPLLAVVGTRKCTHYGKQVVEQIVTSLTRAGIVVVSGLAFGIDKLAHTACLEAGGETIAVLGSGVDDDGITPTSHRILGQEITRHGALVSEFPPGTIAQPGNFPQRNRLVAGMTLGTLVIEGEEDSGSLITARLALDYNREVFAIPGSIFMSTSRGTNTLIKAGARLTTCLEDILEELPLSLNNLTNSVVEKKSSAFLSALEQKIHTLLSHEHLHVDELIQRTSSTPQEVNSALSLLEVRGYIQHIGNKHYRAL